MKSKNLVVALLAAIALVAGCSGDVAQQVVSNEQLRGQVLDAIAHHPDIALQTADRLVASDTLRVNVVNHLLLNKDVAEQVIVRIGTNSDAVDMVLGIAMRDSAMRGHVLTLMKGVQMAGGNK